MSRIHTILLPTRPQPDTIVAIFLLQTFGKGQFLGIEDARVQVKGSDDIYADFESALGSGVLMLDVGGGPLDHHGTDQCASQIVARYLNITDNPALHQVLVYARRDDKEGRGIVSKDGIDRAFGLSGLIASLNKVHIDEPHVVVASVLPLLSAHYASAVEHHIELPAEIALKRTSGLYEEFSVVQSGKPVLVSCVVSNKPSMPGYLRSSTGPRSDVIVQKLEDTNHVSILSRRERAVDLSKVAGLIRLHESSLRGIDLAEDEAYAMKTGAIPELAHWYFDPATNSVLNGGPHNKNVEPSVISWNDMKRLVLAGLELGTEMRSPASYYLSINLPKDAAERILAKMTAHASAKLHAHDNLHVTLEFFGAKTEPEIEVLAHQIAEALSGRQSFALSLRHDQLRNGPIEGYADGGAWYLSLPAEEVAHVKDLRASVLSKIAIPHRDKDLHVTIASKKKGTKAHSYAVKHTAPFAEEIVVQEIALMESLQTERGRVYRPYRTYQLS